MISNKNKIALALFAVITIAGQLFQHYSFIHQQDLGLFLFTGDYFTSVFRGDMPVISLISSFLVQFYDIFLLGPALTALLALAVYLMLEKILRRLIPAYSILPALLLSCVIWVFSAHCKSPEFLVAATLAVLVLYLFSLLLKEKEASVMSMNVLAPGVAVLLLSSAVVALSPKVRYDEKKSAIEILARQGRWDRVLEKATPEYCEKHREFLPYALLALNTRGQLASGMFAYPVKVPEDLDMDGVISREGYYFSSILYECLGCYNEAIHLIFQSSMFLDHGMGFVTLYQLLRYNIENQNYAMVEKYARILARSPRNHFLARRIIKAYSGRSSRQQSGMSSDDALITNNPMQNLGILYKSGIQTQLGAERLSAYMSMMSQQE